MGRALVFAYGLTSYLLFFGTFLYSIGFIGDLFVPKSINSGSAGPLGTTIVINTILLSIFAVQHSGMARPGFKGWLTRFIPEPAERSTYVLLSTVALWVLYAFWQPVPAVVWSVESGGAEMALTGLYFAGWGLVLYSTILISHFDLFGLRQVTLYLQGREYGHLPFDTPSLYGFVRHPLYIGWLTVFWAAPTMTAGRLFFALVCTGYILVAIQIEERDLVGHFGDRYKHYKDAVPMLIPAIKRRAKRVTGTASA
jgi:protein-S-isoprenylcysteine O-methyltransferase Ste14